MPETNRNEGINASSWLLLALRAGAALLVGVALLVAARRLDLATFAGALGLYAITDGVFSLIAWRGQQNTRAPVVEGIIGVVTGFCALLSAQAATALLVWFALRAVGIGAVQAWCGNALRKRNMQEGVWLLMSGAVAGLIGLGFVAIAPFGYDAMDLRYCIVGQLSLFGGLLGTYALKSRPAGHERHSYHSPSARWR